MEDAKSTVQVSLERTAQLTEMLFGAPSIPVSYALVAASSLAGLFLLPTLDGLLAGFLVLALPGFVAGAASAPLASALGGTFYQRRAAFLAAVGCALVAAGVGGSRLLGLVYHVNPVHGLLLGYALMLALRHSVLYAMCDIRHQRTLPVTMLPYVVAMPGLVFFVPQLSLGAREAFLAVALPLIYVGSSIFFLRLFDAPLRKNFNVSAFDLFRYFLDHFTTGNPHGEHIMDKFGEPIQAKVGVIAFRRLQGAIKACIVVPALHPGPVGELGGGDLPGK
ncbi:MAG TPA: DUF2070 family protein, partial [Candidatus Thermoplasmatota archaeon]|nr:DUF2070 family protein [Candidatus Thermoplasmatota archaeon]